MHQNYLLILFYSATGAVKNLAHAIADGAEKKGIEVRIRTVPKVSSVAEAVEASIPEKGEIYCTKEDLIGCAGIALGSPTRFGSMAAPLKYFLDSTGDIWSNNELENKLGCVFTSTGSMHGGQEITLFNLMTYLLHQGVIFVGSPYSISDLSNLPFLSGVHFLASIHTSHGARLFLEIAKTYYEKNEIEELKALVSSMKKN